MIEEFSIPVYIACSISFLDTSITCAALVNIGKTFRKKTENHFSLLLVILNSLSVKYTVNGAFESEDANTQNYVLRGKNC